MTETDRPLRAAIIPVTPFQQNCTLLWCTKTMRGAFVDPGGDLPRLKAAAQQQGVTIEKLILTHGHIDHAGEAKPLADDLSVPIEGPHRADQWLLDDLGGEHSFGLKGVPFTPDRWLVEGDQVRVGKLVLDTYETPGHTPGHVIFHHPASRLALVGDVLFAGSVGRTDFPRSNHQALINSVVTKLWPLGDDTAFIPGHGEPSSFGRERQANPFVADSVLAA
jgi:glyoxylase-like metal-dependent hydrolase (beta-lactamase superfamily II)